MLKTIYAEKKWTIFMRKQWIVLINAKNRFYFMNAVSSFENTVNMMCREKILLI